MKELWTILMDKLREIEAQEAAIGIAIVGMFAIGMATVVIVKFFAMISQIALGASGHPVG
jgi:hypothetical protein